MQVLLNLEKAVKENKLPEALAAIVRPFFLSYQKKVLENGGSEAEVEKVLQDYLSSALHEIEQPYDFPPYHVMQKEPFDFNLFGKRFIGPLIEKKRSKLFGQETLDSIEQQLEKGENAVLLANHQIEADPQVIQLMIGEKYPKLADEMIFVAGHRVTTDPLAIPFSRGCNLICIYSKKHIEFPPEKKAEKLSHNQKSVQKIGQLLSEGGKCIYVAPSGGRDRKNQDGEVAISPFDPQSVELFRLLGARASKNTHFYSLALSTYEILPPPDGLIRDLSEERAAGVAPAGLFFGQELDLKNYPGNNLSDRTLRRQQLSDYVWGIVKHDYDLLLASINK